ncbi:leucine-rich repeat domain-containing protein [Microcoleus asticus]|uniref:Internalin-A n=1 Tax=Microcoleus asticus IPMA8 TaxID=2563858 RepID=A0ABX2D7C2_9CYAN|nr:leucine-rich repeat protein [Microcoleus asticus]NQE38466.1 Internalin-A [Microcoleus asticus IPMA8]
MALIVTDKHMNLPKRYRKQGVVEVQRLIAVTCSAMVLTSCGNGFSVLVADKLGVNSRGTFADWCRGQANLSPEAKHTVEVILQRTGTTKCHAASLLLLSVKELDLTSNQISDIKPLQSLTMLTDINLSNNQISDIKPLQSLTNLKKLTLRNNQISDIKPLESLTNLTHLRLDNNQISDIKPLQSLTNLTELYLVTNEISDITPLDISENNQSLCVVKLLDVNVIILN